MFLVSVGWGLAVRVWCLSPVLGVFWWPCVVFDRLLGWVLFGWALGDLAESLIL
jgi:hypothetical protein